MTISPSVPSIRLSCFLVNMLLATTAGPLAGQEVPSTYRVPLQLDDMWATASVRSLGLSSESMERMTQQIRGGAYSNVHALLIVKDGNLVYERYFTGEDLRYGSDGERRRMSTVFHRDTLHDIRSAGKSITSAVVGLSLESGMLESLDAPLLQWFPEVDDLARELSRITLRHALTMSAGLDWNEEAVPYTDPANHAEQMGEDDDPIGFALDRSVAANPGEAWSYNSALPILVGIAVARAANQPFGEFAQQHLFEPLGITRLAWTGPPRWSSLPELGWIDDEPWSRVANPGGSLWMRPRDLAKFAALYLDGGRWKGVQVLPAGWVELSTDRHIALPESLVQLGPDVDAEYGYGLWWYQSRYHYPDGALDVQSARGNGGQRIFLVPSMDLLVVHLTGNYNEEGAGHLAERLLLEWVVPWAQGEDGAPASFRSRRPFTEQVDELSVHPLTPMERERYLGTYDHEGQQIRVWEDSKLLRMTPLAGDEAGGPIHLIPLGEHVFAFGRYENSVPTRVYWPQGRLEFVLEDGLVVRYLDRTVEGRVWTTAERLR